MGDAELDDLEGGGPGLVLNGLVRARTGDCFGFGSFGRLKVSGGGANDGARVICRINVGLLVANDFVVGTEDG